MKMISAVKYARAERDLRPARPFGEGARQFYSSVELTQAPKKPEHLLVLTTSDRGLCGACHSNISRALKHDLGDKHEGDFRIVCIGDKSKAQLQKIYGKSFLFTINEYGRKPPTFEDAAKIAQAILNSGFSFSQGDIYFNRFKTVVSYKTEKLPIFSFDAISKAPKIGSYDSVDDDVLTSYMEYSLANLLYYAMKESACSEQSSRMTAMDAASKNAGEMIDKLTMTFNRTRQAVITKELIEIISGAAAV